MSSIVISGDTSGAITLAAPAVAGTNTLTLPASTGTVALTGAAVTRAQLPAGTVLQVVSQTFTPSTGSTTSTTPATTGVSLAITPTSSTSKVLCLVNGGWGYLNNAAGGMYYYLYKNGTDISGPINQLYSSVATVITGNTSISFLNSPATTSATTYAVYFASRGGNAVVGYEGGTNVQMILMEIAA